jgi:hypothetical protein
MAAEVQQRIRELEKMRASEPSSQISIETVVARAPPTR